MTASRLLSITAFLVISSSSAAARAQSPAACANAAETAQTLRENKKLVEARRELVSCAVEACPKVVRHDCTRWLEEVNQDLPSIAVVVRDASGADVVDARVLLDNIVAWERADATSLPVNPGTHTIRVEPKAGGPPTEVNVAIPAGKKNQVIEVKLASRSAPAKPPPAPLPPPAPAVTTARAVPIGTYVAGGVAIAALGTFTVLEIIAQKDASGLRDGCGQTKSCSHDDVTAAHTKLDIAAALLGVGVIAAGTAVVLYFMNSPTDSKSAFRDGKFYF